MLFARELVVLPLSIPGPPGPAGPSERGVSYTRWGGPHVPTLRKHSSCTLVLWWGVGSEKEEVITLSS